MENLQINIKIIAAKYEVGGMMEGVIFVHPSV